MYVIFGRCACGAALTVQHLQFFCPLYRQRRVYEEEELPAIIRAMFESRLDMSHVAVLGEN